MELYWKSAALCLIALILILTLEKQAKDVGTLVAIAVCCMIGIAAFTILAPVLDYLYSIYIYADMDRTLYITVLKLVGTGLIAELIAMLCCDAGCSSLGKSIQLLASAMILSLSVPIFEQFFALLKDILGGI